MNEERTHGDCSAISDDEELPRPFTVMDKLRAAMEAYDQYVAPCPFDPSKTKRPNSLDPCKVCSATMGTGCHRKAYAGAEVVTMVRRILHGDA